MPRLTRGRSPCAARRSTFATRFRATFPPRKSASASTATNRSTGLCRRAWRNTLRNRPFTVTEKQDSLQHELRVAIAAAQEKQAAEITLLDFQGLGAFTDGFLLCTGFSARPVDAICDEIEQQLARTGVHLRHREGTAGAEWILLDFGRFTLPIVTQRA